MAIYINSHTHHINTTNSETISLVNLEVFLEPEGTDYPFSVGLHPWFVNESNIKELNFDAYLNNSNFLAIGECGLDRVRNANFVLQVKAFYIQLRYASNYNLPLIIHCVRAYSDILEILKREKFKGKIIFHDFRGNIHEYNQLAKYNSWFSFGKSLFEENKKQTEVFCAIPITNILLETDDISISIEVVYQKAAILRSVDLNFLKEMLEKNFASIFEKETTNK